MEKTKILFVSHESCIMGSTVSLLSLIKGLKEINMDLDIRVILPFSVHGKAKRRLRSNCIKYKEFLYRYNYFHIDRPRRIREYIYDIINFFTAGILSIYMKINSISIVCSNSTAVDIGARAALMANIPHIFYVREFMEEDHGFSYRNSGKMKYLLEASDSVVFISKAIEKKYRSLYHLKNTRQFFNGFIIQDYYIPARNILHGKKISFIQVGRLNDGKGALNTIGMLNNLNKNGIINWSMEFVGIGEKGYVAKMKCLLSEYQLENQITISGYCEHMEKKLADKDILIMNSKLEGFGRVTVEAMLAGCLVIGRSGGGTSEIITNGINGMIFGDEAQFTGMIQDVINNRKQYKDIAVQGQKYALDKFHYINTAKEFMKVVKGCI